MEQNQVKKILERMEQGDVNMVSKAFDMAMTQLEREQTAREQERAQSLENKTLEELDQELARTSPTNKFYDAILETRRVKLNKHLAAQNAPSQAELEQAHQEYQNLKRSKESQIRVSQVS